jgi:hypothetical protein
VRPLVPIRDDQQIAENHALLRAGRAHRSDVHVFRQKDLASQVIERKAPTHDYAMLIRLVGVDFEPGHDARRVQRLVEYPAHTHVMCLLGAEVARREALPIEVIEPLERGVSRVGTHADRSWSNRA